MAEKNLSCVTRSQNYSVSVIHSTNTATKNYRQPSFISAIYRARQKSKQRKKNSISRGSKFFAFTVVDSDHNCDNIAELKTALLSIWNDLPRGFTDKAILSFLKKLRFCVAAAGVHFEHSV